MIRVCPHSDSICRNGMGCTFSCATDAYDGTKRPVDNSPIPALGGTEAEGRSEPEHTGDANEMIPATPVRGLEPAKWAAVWTGHTGKRCGEVFNTKVEAAEAAEWMRGDIEPLYSASDVSALQGEVERLRKALTRIGWPEYGQGFRKLTRIARQAMEQQQ